MYIPTHRLGALRSTNTGQTVTLSGWVHRRRDHGGLVFIDLRDRFGLTQLVFDPSYAAAHALAETFRSEWVITVTGKVRPRAAGMTNPKLATGEIEVEAQSASVLSQAKTPPFSICDENIDVHEELRLTYRYLDMRRGDIIKNLLLRAKIQKHVRNYLDENTFCEVQTPVLCKATPEGARDYLVPSRVYPGSFYALPQSPQLFKQLLMLGGLDRYYQICPCFRDEDLRADRQPEFYQIDIELSFGNREILFSIIEGLFVRLCKEVLGLHIPTPFPRLTYAECFERYGCDKPDTRYGLELFRIDDIVTESNFSILKEQINSGGVVKALAVPQGKDLSRKQIDDYTAFVAQFGLKGLAWMKVENGLLTSSVAKFFTAQQQDLLKSRLSAAEGSCILIGAGPLSCVNQALDQLRRKIAADRNLCASDKLNFLWVVDFPLFERDAETGQLQACHHPFTGVHPEDKAFLETDPAQARSLSYDLVLNGFELGSGSERIFDSATQTEMFRLLQLTPEEIERRFGFFVGALSYGTPPHMGIALGIERICMLFGAMTGGLAQIRDYVAFPKTQRAADLMLGAPSEPDPGQLSELKIKIEENVALR